MTELVLILYSWQFYEQNKTTLDIYFLLKIFFYYFTISIRATKQRFLWAGLSRYSKPNKYSLHVFNLAKVSLALQIRARLAHTDIQTHRKLLEEAWGERAARSVGAGRRRSIFFAAQHGTASVRNIRCCWMAQSRTDSSNLWTKRWNRWAPGGRPGRIGACMVQSRQPNARLVTVHIQIRK